VRTRRRNAMGVATNAVQQKVSAIFSQLTGERANHLVATRHPQEVKAVLTSALIESHSQEVAAEIAFHLVDWNSDAAFLVALHLYPERFTAEEIRAGVFSLLPHVPNHVTAAAKLAGYMDEE
jgi:hypothetical protein